MGDLKNSNGTIDIMENGPFIVHQVEEMTDADGNVYEKKTKMALCRCGASANKPYCDGTHAKIGYSGARETDRDLNKERDYQGDEITIHDNRTICSHAAVCVQELGSVFNLDKKPWIDANGASASEIIALIKKCPSGALSYTVNDQQHRNPDRSPAIRIAKNGPYNIEGGIQLNIDDAMQPPASEHYALCRCGASANKPYCDGTHRTAGFDDSK